MRRFIANSTINYDPSLSLSLEYCAGNVKYSSDRRFVIAIYQDCFWRQVPCFAIAKRFNLRWIDKPWFGIQSRINPICRDWIQKFSWRQRSKEAKWSSKLKPKDFRGGRFSLRSFNENIRETKLDSVAILWKLCLRARTRENFFGINRSAEYDSAIITEIKFDGINIIINKCLTVVLNDVLAKRTKHTRVVTPRGTKVMFYCSFQQKKASN